MFRALGCALGFLTRLPVPAVTLSDTDVARSAGFFSWVGWLVAGLLLGISQVSSVLGPRLGALLTVTAWALITGALHLDGLADTVDGLSGGRGDRARALEIMRDSRIGAHGAVALVLALGIKWAALERALESGAMSWWTAPVVARFACTLLLASFPYARARGLGSSFAGRVGAPELAVGAIALVPALWIGGGLGAACVVAGLTCALAVAGWAQRRLGGLTGDVHGAAIESCEIGMLLAMSAIGLR